MNKNRSITGLSFTSTFLISLSLLLFIGYLWYESEQRAMESSFAAFKMEYLESQRENIRRDVDKAVDYIAYNKSLTEYRVRQEIKMRVEEAWQLADNLYRKFRDTRSLDEIQTMVKEALRPLRFNEGRGYYFATRLDGVEMLFADRPQLEGKNLLGMKDLEGKHVIKDMIDIARNDGEGFYTYKWTKPGKAGKGFPKAAYIKYFAPFDWFIGTGEYIDDMEQQIQREVIERIGQIRFGVDGYIFILREDGLALSHLDKSMIGKWVLETKDINGKYMFRDMVELVQTDGKGFVNYLWNKPSLDRAVNKLTYVRGVSDWKWVVGTGVYLDDLDAALAAAKQRLDEQVRHEVQTVSILLVVLILVSLGLSYYLSNRIGRALSSFNEFFSRAVSYHEKIDVSDLDFTEFKELGDNANRMVDDIAHAKSDLAELNAGLEKQVRLRTEELEEANRELIKLDEVKSSFISTVSHELRTPLTSILGFTKLIKKDVTKHFVPLGDTDKLFSRKSGRVLQNLDIMESEGERLTRLVSDILDLSKIESGHMEWRLVEVDVRESVDIALKAMQGRLAKKSGIEVKNNMPEALPSIVCDQDRLAQVFINLLGNAIKYMEVGTIRVEAKTLPHRMLKISVTDEGPGIAPEDCRIIFSKFRQAQNGPGGFQTGGTGLGLAISKHIVEHFGGKIWVESEIGEGSTFNFTLPHQ